MSGQMDSAAHDLLRSRGYDPASLIQQYNDEGYVILDNVLSPDASSRFSLENLRRVAETAVDLTRSGKWPHRRIVGNAFPPFEKDNRDSWGVQHLMSPHLTQVAQAGSYSKEEAHQHASGDDLGVDLAKIFQDFYASSPLLDIASLLLSAPIERMQMELFNLLINPSHHLFALGWHRDDVRPDVDEQEEKERLATPTFGVQFNCALWDDDCLFIVPETHRRVRTAAEIKANQAKPPKEVEVTADGHVGRNRAANEGKLVDGFNWDGAWNVDPPETLRVHLKAGQTVFYSQRLLHRASYLPTRKRATLHGCYGDSFLDPSKSKTSSFEDEEANTPHAATSANGDAKSQQEQMNGSSERARNVLQHGVEWMRDSAFGDSLNERSKPMWQNLLRMDALYSKEPLGYSLSNDN